MAERRMFSKRIVRSARFLKMPVSSRELYWQLGIDADDDGIVESFNVMRMSGATEDDLRVLVTKGFVQILNEDLVAYITDWNENNKLRADRKIDSIYKDLLIQINPDVKLIEPKQRADTKKLTGQPMDVQRTTNGQPMDGIGKDRLGKVSLVEDSIYSPAEAEQVITDKINYKKIIDRLNELAGTSYRASTKSTKDLIKARMNDGFTEEDLITVVEKMCYLWNREPQKNQQDMRPYLRPSTLFQASKFEGYLNRPVEKIKKTTRDIQDKIDFSDF